MQIVVITPPAARPISLEEAKEHVGQDFAHHDDLITSLIDVVTRHVDAPDGWLGRALVEQTLERRLDSFCTEIRLPYPPIIAIVSITYTDQAGAEQTVAPADYRIVGAGTKHVRVAPVYGKCWPTARCDHESVRVRYKAGFGADGGFVPPPIRHGLLLLLGHFYQNREAVSVGQQAFVMPQTVDALLQDFRVYY